MPVYKEGNITYENKNGNIYKNGKLVPRSNYQYIPSVVGGTRVDPTPVSAPVQQTPQYSSTNQVAPISQVVTAAKNLQVNPNSYPEFLDTVTQNYGTGSLSYPGNMLALQNAVAPPLPELVIPVYTPPDLPTIDLSAATAQARGEVDPMTQLMKQQTNQLYQEQRERLPQQLNAMGRSVSGGSRIVGERNLTNQQAQALGSIDQQQEAKILELARGIMDRNAEQVRQQQEQAYNQWQEQQNLNIQAYNAKMAQQEALRNAVTNAAQMILAQKQWEQEQAQKGNEFDFEKAKWQDTLAQSAKEQAWEQEKWNKEWPYKEKQYQYELNKPYYAPSKVSSGGGSKTSNKAKEYTIEYLSQVPTYTNRDQALDAWNKYKTVMQQRGVDPGIILAEINRLFPEPVNNVNNKNTSKNNFTIPKFTLGNRLSIPKSGPNAFLSNLPR